MKEAHADSVTVRDICDIVRLLLHVLLGVLELPSMILSLPESVPCSLPGSVSAL